MLTVPDRAGPVLTETATVTLPLPVPFDSVVTASHPAWLVALQLQPAGALTATAAAPPPGPIEAPPGLIAYEQVELVAGGFSPWFTVTVWPATVSDPDRAAPVFAPTEKL